MRDLVIIPIRLYQRFLSPLLGPRCRFYPSCSEYAIIAVRRYGIWRGGYFAIKRILKCHPLSEGGIDLVPEKRDGKITSDNK